MSAGKHIAYQRQKAEFDKGPTSEKLRSLLITEAQYQHMRALERSRTSLGLPSSSVYVKKLDPTLVRNKTKNKKRKRAVISLTKRQFLLRIAEQHELSEIRWKNIVYEMETIDDSGISIATSRQEKQLVGNKLRIARIHDTTEWGDKKKCWLATLQSTSGSRETCMVYLTERWLKQHPALLVETEYVLQKEFGIAKQQRKGVEVLVRIVKLRGFRKLECVEM